MKSRLFPDLSPVSLALFFVQVFSGPNVFCLGDRGRSWVVFG